MLPTTFGNTLWFSEEELRELRGTNLYRATELQKKSLLNLYETKVKDLVMKLLNLDGDSEIEVCFEDFLWANSVFWSRALNIPMPRSYVFPEMQDVHQSCTPEADEKGSEATKSDDLTKETTHSTVHGETVWVEGLVPGIDFCNHDLKPIATWEVDGIGLTTGVPVSMYLLSAAQSPLQIDREISISYGNKGMRNFYICMALSLMVTQMTISWFIIHQKQLILFLFPSLKASFLKCRRLKCDVFYPKLYG
ncbi:unnamed protein product [Lathyrus sativus]|nr:unnamed protein product [Lathyrus sativus]